MSSRVNPYINEIKLNTLNSVDNNVKNIKNKLQDISPPRLSSKIIPYAERFYKLSNGAQEMILHYGDNVEEGFNTACRCELQLEDRHSAAFLDDYRMYNEVSDFYWKTKLVTTPYKG